MKTLVMLAVMLTLTACDQAAQVVAKVSGSTPVQWEHGWKTDRVTATRYANAQIGYHIGFDFPKNIDDADDEAVSDFFRYRNCGIFQGGGTPGATAYVQCSDVHDRASADVKLKAILPDLDVLMTKLALGIKIEKTADELAYDKAHADDWQKCDPATSLGMAINSTQYRCDEKTHRWVEDTAAEQAMAKNEEHKAELFAALTTRVLTDAELKEAAGYGSSLNVQNWVPFDQKEKSEELSRVFEIQRMLRESAKQKATDTAL